MSPMPRTCYRAPLVLLLAAVLSALMCTGASADRGGDKAAEQGKLVLSHSLVSLLNEVPGVWAAVLKLPEDTEAGAESALTSVEVGELRLERQSASAVTLHLPPLAEAPHGRLAFNAISCEEYKHSKGKCFFFLSDDDGVASQEEDVDDSELYVDYLVQHHRKRIGGRADSVEEEEEEANAAGDEAEEEQRQQHGQESEEAEEPLGAAHRRHRRKGKKSAAPQEATPKPAKPVNPAFRPTTAPLLKLQAVDAGAAQSEDRSAVVGTVTVTEERLKRNGIEVVAGEVAKANARRAVGETKEYRLTLRFHLTTPEATGTTAVAFPTVLELRGLTGNVQEHLAVRQRQEKLRVASSFFGRWVYPLCFLAGMYGVLWLAKVGMDQRAQQAKVKPAGAAAPAKGPAKAPAKAIPK